MKVMLLITNKYRICNMRNFSCQLYTGTKGNRVSDVPTEEEKLEQDWVKRQSAGLTNLLVTSDQLSNISTLLFSMELTESI